MTVSNPSIQLDGTSDATFQAMGTAISAALAAVGLVKSADTGQINWATATKAAGGYEIWAFTDSLQATKPVFIRISYTVSGVAPQFTFTVGTGTNGAGTMTGNFTTTQQSRAAGVGYTAGTVPCFLSSDGSYLALALGVGGLATGGVSGFLVVDRTRNADGTANGDGIYAVTWGLDGNSNPLGACNTLRYDIPVTGRNWQKGTNAVFPQDAGMAVASPNQNSFVVGTDVLVFPHNVYAPKAEAPASAILGLAQGDIAAGTTFQTTHLGATHTFVSMGSGMSAMGSYTSTAGVGLQSAAVRYE